MILRLATICSLFASPIAAQECGPRDIIVARLQTLFQERKRASGLISHLEIMEVWASKTGSWTVLRSNIYGYSCVIVTGKNFGLWPVRTIDKSAPL